ncbi:MAG: NUDIX-like domain-containing protein, partial [Vicinamibacteria bacterium]
MHTPAGFVPSHRLPAELPSTTLAFAFAGAKLVVRGSVDAPAVTTLADLDAAGLRGERHYLGVLDGIPCVAIALDESAAAPEG